MLGVGRPWRAARAFTPRTMYCAARGPAPQLTQCRTKSDAPGSAGRVARTVVIKLRHTDMHTVTRSETISAPTDDLAELAATAERLLLDPAEFGGIRLAGVAFSGLSVPHQDALFSLAVPETVAATVVSPAPAPAASPSTWRQGDDVVHAEFGTGWVQGAGHGRVTVRFETRDSGPGAARTFDQDDRELKRGEPTDCLG